MSRKSNRPCKKNSRKLAVVSLAFVLSVCLAAILLGCESTDKEKAQEYLQAGADQIQKIRSQAAEWQSQMISATGSTDSKTVKSVAGAVKLSAQGMSDTIARAREEYKKVTQLQGVDEYVEYAKLRLVQLDLMQEMLNKTDEFLIKKVAVVKSEDLASLADLEEQYSGEISRISDEVQKIDEKAAKMKKDERL
jgi:mannitol-specific phosphotransferase system IIBC component